MPLRVVLDNEEALHPPLALLRRGRAVLVEAAGRGRHHTIDAREAAAARNHVGAGSGLRTTVRREAIQLVFVLDPRGPMLNREAGAILGISHQAATARVRRGLRTLAEREELRDLAA